MEWSAVDGVYLRTRAFPPYNFMLDAFEKATDEPSDLLILGNFNIDYKMDEPLHENQINLIETYYF